MSIEPAWSGAFDRGAIQEVSALPFAQVREWAFGGSTGAGVRVAVIDSGVDAEHPRVGGVVGAATAFFAGRAGLRAVLLEARPALATLTTPASTGAFRLQFDNPEEIALVREGIAFFDAFAEATGLPGYDLGLRHGGYLFCTTTETGMGRQAAWVAAQHGLGLTDVELLDGDEARYGNNTAVVMIALEGGALVPYPLEL